MTNISNTYDNIQSPSRQTKKEQINDRNIRIIPAFSALTLLVGWQEGHLQWCFQGLVFKAKAKAKAKTKALKAKAKAKDL